MDRILEKGTREKLPGQDPPFLKMSNLLSLSPQFHVPVESPSMQTEPIYCLRLRRDAMKVASRRYIMPLLPEYVTDYYWKLSVISAH